MQGPQFSTIFQTSEMISKLLQAPDAKMLNRANETLRTNFPQNLISPWSEIGVKLYSKINTGMSKQPEQELQKNAPLFKLPFQYLLALKWIGAYQRSWRPLNQFSNGSILVLIGVVAAELW